MDDTFDEYFSLVVGTPTIISSSTSFSVGSPATVHIYNPEISPLTPDSYVVYCKEPLNVPAEFGVSSNDKTNFIPGTISVQTDPIHGTVSIQDDGSFQYHACSCYDSFVYRFTSDFGELEYDSIVSITIESSVGKKSSLLDPRYVNPLYDTEIQLNWEPIPDVVPLTSSNASYKLKIFENRNEDLFTTNYPLVNVVWNEILV